MLFPSNVFLFVFLPVVLVIYYLFLRKTKQVKNVFLLLVSFFFYAWGARGYVVLMIVTIIINYIYGLLVDKWRLNKVKSRIVLVLMVLSNLGILGYYKYFRFAILQINRFLHTSFAEPMIELPIGISFFTFQAMSYVIDVYRQKGKVQKNPLKVGLYIALFPQLIAGPIVRYETIAEQIDNRKENFADFSSGVERFIVGLGKKVLIANNMAHVADQVFDFLNTTGFHSSVSTAWLGAIAYTLQIFFDFSGYSDMAIGLGRMFGFHFEENFNYPYIAHNISDFWRRWHISMQTWFKDYVYIPLGGGRVKFSRKVFNMFVVWVCTGIWHGANWTYLAWGMLNFLLLLFEGITGLNKKKSWLTHIYTVVFILVSMVVFKSPGLGAAKNYVFAMFGIGAEGLYSHVTFSFIRNNWLYFIFGILACFPIIPCINKKYGNTKAWNILYFVGLLVVLIMSLTFIYSNAYNPFIYFNF